MGRARQLERLAVAGLGVVTTVLLALGIAVAAPGGRGGGRPSPTTVEFEVTGHVDGLYPGDALPLPVTVSNPYGFAIEIASLEVTVGDASAACPSSTLAVEPPPTGARVDAGTDVVVTGQASMAETAPNACQGAVFPLHYVATARVAH